MFTNHQLIETVSISTMNAMHTNIKAKQSLKTKHWLKALHNIKSISCNHNPYHNL